MKAQVGSITVPTGHWIDGRRMVGNGVLSVTSPIDGAELGEVPCADAKTVDMAVAAADAAFPAWSQRSPAARGQVLTRFAELIRARAEDFCQIETADNGSLLSANRHALIDRSARNISFFADFATRIEARHWDGGENGSDNDDRVERMPSGVAALISPWNAPLMLATWKLGPALAAGSTIVMKPPELAPLTCSLLVELAAEVGLPPGVFNLVHGDGATTGDALVRHPRVARISFTGSTATARSIARAAADNLTPLSFELGGKSPLLVFSSADLEAATATIVRQYFNAGQVCLAGTRLLIERNIADDLLDRVQTAIAALTVGDPRSADTRVGPLISQRQHSRVDGFVRRAIDAGAAVLAGGKPSDAGALYYQPTLLGVDDPGMEIVREEVFGPVLTWQVFDSEEEAIALANDSDYGLAATVFSQDPAQASRVASAIVAGTVWINSFFVRNLAAPFGGARRSGVGREGGDWSFDFFCDVKTVSTRRAVAQSGEKQ